MSERIKNQGRKVQKTKELKDLELKADNLISTVRDKVDPFEEWLEIDSAHAFTAMEELHRTIIRGKKIKKDIEELERALGER